MWQSIGPLVLLLGLLALLPSGLKWLKQRQAAKPGRGWFSSDMVSSVAVGPQQHVVTVEVGPVHNRTWLVLGVTTQQITCLHTIPMGDQPGSGSVASAASSPVLSGTAAATPFENLSRVQSID
jgi:flagellar protein FliO/FliZ